MSELNDTRILVVTNTHDLHADLIVDKMLARGGRPFRLNLDEFPARFQLSVEFVDQAWEGSIRHLPTGDVLRLADVGAVWMRKKADFAFLDQMQAQEQAYAQAEMEQVVFSLLYSLDCYWMSHPIALRGAIWKGEQLLRAQKMGFATPPSLITNARAGLEAFARSGARELVFKALSSASLAAELVSEDERIAGTVGTTLITAEHEELLDGLPALPCFFQQHIIKQYEVRATVIGDQVFAAKIHSQDDPRTAIDYRDFSVEIPYEAMELPADVARRCIEFVHSYGLQFGAIDLIVTPDGRYVFLENNPVGQFLFVEQLVPELKMMDAVADCLVRGAQAGRPRP